MDGRGDVFLGDICLGGPESDPRVAAVTERLVVGGAAPAQPGFPAASSSVPLGSTILKSPRTRGEPLLVGVITVSFDMAVPFICGQTKEAPNAPPR